MYNSFFDLEEISHDEQIQRFRDHMDFLKGMTNEEHTLYKKWIEVKELKKIHERASMVRKNIWHATDLNNVELTVKEISELRPAIQFVDPSDRAQIDNWYALRVFIHSMEFEQNPGRFLRFFITDEVTGKYLGAASLASDVISITCRDNWIGWTKENRIDNRMINHSAIATTIVSVQPFGYNMLGGKLIASMLSTKNVREAWNKLYDQQLVGITTTSLYGAHSMYQRIPFWKELGETNGRIVLKPDYEFYKYWHDYVKTYDVAKYEKETRSPDGTKPATGIKQKILNLIFKQVGLKPTQFEHGFKRGVFYCPLFENTKEFLRQEIPIEKLVPLKRLQDDVDGVLAWWVPKAVARYTKLHAEGRLSNQELFYTKMIDMTWDEAKAAYLQDVGR